MKCPFCGGLNDKVVNSRLTRKGMVVRRRRKCLTCYNKFTTYENVEKMLLVVVKKDGRREPFSLSKIKRGIYKAREKLDLSARIVNKVANNLEFELMASGKRIFNSSYVGEKVMLKLQKVSGIAYVRFASVYREFKKLSDFEFELKNLLKK